MTDDLKLPGEQDISRALHYLAETDQNFARMTARVKALEYQVKTIKALEYLSATGTVAEREATAESSKSYRAWIEDYENAVADRETMYAKRKRAELTIDVWRSLNANRRQGS